MSITGLSEQDKIYRNRNDSGELDVFEATRYFSGCNEAVGYNGTTFTQKIMREDRQAWKGGRISLDVPMRNPFPQMSHGVEKHMKEKKHKQPSSPGGKLASFLNSLFNQTNYKKKKSKSATQSMKDEEESPGGRRRRRSSISHFPNSSNTDSRSIYSSSNSGFRTPPHAHTPTKVYKDFRSYSDDKQEVSLSNYNGHVKPTALQNEVLDEKLRFSHGVAEKYKNLGNGYPETNRIWVDQYPSEEKEFRKFNQVDDGAESDSSSDLFELQNYDLGYYSSGLPVYETTHMDSIKRGIPISNGPL